MTYPSDQPTYSAPTSTMAIVSLISGLLGLTFLPTIGSIVALITGYNARNEIRANPSSVSGDGLATAGIVLGWVGVGLACCTVTLAIVLVVAIFIFGLTLFGISASDYSWLLPILAGI